MECYSRLFELVHRCLHCVARSQTLKLWTTAFRLCHLLFVLFQNVLHNAICKLRMHLAAAALHYLTDKEPKKLRFTPPVRFKVLLRFLPICRKS